MKNAAAVLISIVFILGTAVASPYGEGGGSSSDDNESNLAAILMVSMIVGFSALLVTDILSDDGIDSQDALAGISDTTSITDDTGIDWGQLSSDSSDINLPVIAVTVFQGEAGRDHARYFTALLAPGESVHYLIQGTPVALGRMSSAEAASTGFTFMNCDLIITGDDTGLQLFERGSPEPVWSHHMQNPDSSAVREASAGLLEFISNR